MIKVFIAGGTGWAGSELSKGVFNHPNMQLTGVLSRTHAGKNLAEILDLGKALYSTSIDLGHESHFVS